MNVKTIFGENLKHLRKLNKVTQDELSERIGITPTHLSRIENGKSFVTAEFLDALCGFFNVPPAAFFCTPQEFSGDGSPSAWIDLIIDEELKKFGTRLKEKIRA